MPLGPSGPGGPCNVCAKSGSVLSSSCKSSLSSETLLMDLRTLSIMAAFSSSPSPDKMPGLGTVTPDDLATRMETISNESTNGAINLNSMILI